MIRTIKEKHTNAEMCDMLMSTEDIMEKARGTFAYALARNVRRLTDAAQEFMITRNDLLHEYGVEDEDGTVKLKIDSEGFAEFAKRIEPLTTISYDVEITKITRDDIPEDMSATEILNIIWMILEEAPEPEVVKEETVING